MHDIVAFDIETVPDTEAGSRQHGLKDLSDKEIADAMFSQRLRETSGSTDFLKHHLHKVVAIAVVCRDTEGLSVQCIGDESSGEAEMLRQFFNMITAKPTLVSWNGKGFDMPVLHYRCLLHGIDSKVYWDQGRYDEQFRWNNYLNRFHARHTDLMDVLSGYGRGGLSLQDVSCLLSLPGKTLMDGSQVWPTWLDGGIGRIRDYCELDALLTYLVYLRYLLISGRIDSGKHDAETDNVKALLRDSGKEHHAEFMRLWEQKQ